MRDLIIDVETTGLDPKTCQIVAIGMLDVEQIGDQKPIVYVDTLMVTEKNSEEDIITAFWNYCRAVQIDRLVGFNISFDWQFLKLRSIGYEIPIKYYKKYDGRLDLRIVLNPDRYKKGTALKDYCELFSIGVPDEYTGADVPKFFEDKEYEKIEDHLIADIVKTYMLYSKLKVCRVI